MTAPASPAVDSSRVQPSSRLLSRGALVCLLTVALLSPFPGATQTPQSIASAPAAGAASMPAPAASKALPGKPSVTVTPGPKWTDLKPDQQLALQPLASGWNSISEAQKRKWLQISKNYPTLPPADQATMHSRMNEWVTLSAQQRAQARLNFAKTKELSKQLTPEERKARWESYQALSPEEKKQLAAKGVTKPAGAATAVKPVAPQKLSALPKSSGPQRPAAPLLTPLPVEDKPLPGSASFSPQY